MNRRIIKSMFSVTIIIILAKLLGLLRQIVTGNAFGTTFDTDIIMLGQGIVLDIDFVLSQTLITSFIPIYLEEKSKSKSDGETLVSSIIKIVFLGGIVISIGLVLLSPFIARILAPSYSDMLSERLASSIRLFGAALVIIAENSVFSALLKANERFYASEMIGIFQSCSFITCIIILSNSYGVKTLNIAFFVYVGISFLFLFVLSKQYYYIKRGSLINSAIVSRFIKTTGIIFFGYSMVFLNQQVDKIIVSGLGEGILTSLHYGGVLSNFICTFVASMGGVLFTYVTNAVVEKKDSEAAILSFDFAKVFTWFLLPVTIITWEYSDSIVRIVFGRGEFNAMSVYNCSMALKGYCVGFIPFVFREIYSRMLYAYGESKYVTVNSTASILVNIILSIVFSCFWGVFGVTIASSIAIVFCAFLNYYYAHKRNSFVNWREVIINIPWWMLGFFINYIIVRVIKELQVADVYKIIISTMACMILTACVAYNKIKELLKLRGKERRKIE